MPDVRCDPCRSVAVLRYFGDGPIKRRSALPVAASGAFPVMDGEVPCEDTVGQQKAVGGGNFLILGRGRAAVLAAGERAITAIAPAAADIIMPFPAAIVRSGSKLGSAHKGLNASSNLAYLPDGARASSHGAARIVEPCSRSSSTRAGEAAIAAADGAGIRAACAGGGGAILPHLGGNYGRKLAPSTFHLRKLLA